MFNLLVRGWRNINHSIALVNQYQLLEFSKRFNLRLFHEDMPFASADWNPVTNAAGFSAEQHAEISTLSQPDLEEMDAILTIAVPFNPSARKCSRYATFMVTEFGLQASDFDLGGMPARWYEEDNRTIVTPSNWCKRKLEGFGFQPNRIDVIPHGVDQTIFFPITEEERQMSRAQLGLQDDEFVYLNLGGMMANKGVDLVLLAFALVLKKYPNARLLLKDMRQLYQYSTDHLFALINQNHPGLLTQSVLSAIRVVSVNLPINLMRVVYGAADVYVSPYRAEGFNLPVLEAIACGLPTLTTKGGPTDDFCNPRSTGFIDSASSRAPINGQTAPGEYLEPSLDSLVALMEIEISRGRKNLQQRQEIALDVAPENQWAKIAERYLQALQREPNLPKIAASVELYSANEKPAFYCFCEGGLGNRLNSLYASIVLASQLGRPLRVIWPINTWCEASFESLFENSGLDVVDVEMIDCTALISRSTRIVWEDHLKLGLHFRTPESYKNLPDFLEQTQSDRNAIFYCSPLVPDWIQSEQLDKAVLQIKPRVRLIEKAERFISETFACKPFAGLHIRKTDYGKLVDEHLSFQVVSEHPDVIFFVCSDSKDTEYEALNYQNVRIRSKASYVEKRVEGDWNKLIVDESGRHYPFNIRRPALSVEEAIIDLLILSRSQIIKNSTSTFLLLAVTWARVAF